MDELSEDALTALVRRYRQLGSQIAELQGEQKLIQARVDAVVADGWKLTVDGTTASKRSANRRFCVITAVGLLDAEAKARCVQTAYAEKLVRHEVELIGLLEECMLDRSDAAPIVKLS